MAELLLKGAPVAREIDERTRQRVAELRAAGIAPRLAIVRVGDNPADLSYERGIIKRAAGTDIDVDVRETAPEDVVATVRRLSADSAVHGILIFRPLPPTVDDDAVRAAIAPEKDVDGITDASMAGIYSGRGGFSPCTAQAVMAILDHYGVELEGRRATVVGRSLVIGKPVSQMLLSRNATVTVCHSKTRDLTEETRRADVLVTAQGRANAIGPEHTRAGQIVIDVGINTGADGKLCGDVDFDRVSPLCAAITPVPGGVGSVTTAILLSHTVQSLRTR